MPTPVLSRELTGAVVVVTGAGGGIGKAICAALIGAGADVIGTDLVESSSGSPEIRITAHDVTSESSWESVIRNIEKSYGHIDCLVNNAGVSLVQELSRTSIQQLRRVMSVNLEGALLGLQACLPLLRASGETRVGGASVVNVASAAGLRGVPFHSAYCASKGAVTLLTKAAAREFCALGYRVRVNSIHPGSVESPMMDAIFSRYVEEGWSPSLESARTSANTMPPMGRLARAEEVAAGVVFLCSAGSSYMTGLELLVDGGALS